MKIIVNGACGRMGRVVQRVFREKLPDADLIPVDPMTKDGEATPRCRNTTVPPTASWISPTTA